MYNVDEVIQAISIALIVPGFFLNFKRFLKSIELCKECLFILKQQAGIKDDKFTNTFYVTIYFTMWKACSLISDNTNAVKYAKTVAKLTSKLSEMYFHEKNYALTKDLLERALLISKEIVDNSAEACSYLSLGGMYGSLGEYGKAREQLEKSLAIEKEIGDRSVEASSHKNLGVVYSKIGEYKKAKEQLKKITCDEERN